MIEGLVWLTGGFVVWTVGLVGLLRGRLVAVGTCDGALVEDTKSLPADGFAVKTVKVLGFNGCLVGRFTNGFSVNGCLLVRFTKGLRVVEWTLVGCLAPTNDLRVVDWVIGWMACWVARFTNGFSVVE